MNKIIFILILSCISLSQPICFSQCSSDQFPGCLFECKAFSENVQIFELDDSGTTPDCDTSKYKYWFHVTAEESTLKIFNVGSSGCSGLTSFEVRIFDANQLPVSNCKSFSPNSVGQSLEITDAIPGNVYSILVSAMEAQRCEINLLIEGHRFEEFTNTPDIQIGQGSGNRFGTLILPFIPAADDYFWTTNNSKKTRLEKLPAINEIQYFNTNGTPDEICVIPYNDCEVGEEKCITLSFWNCPNGSEIFPGCQLECEDLSIHGSDLSADYSPNNLAGCNDFDIQRGFWTSVIAKDTFLKITQNSFGLDYQIAVQIFDKNKNPLADCQGFLYSPGETFFTTNLQQGEEYSIFIGCEAQVPSSFEINLLVEGHEIKQQITPEIKFIFGFDSTVGRAYLDASSEPRNIIWEYAGDIISGQGTDTVYYKKTASDNQICVKVITAVCGESNQVCETATIVPTGFATPPCLPTAGGIPAQNEAPGCTLCGPIYQGSTIGFTPSAPGSDGFPCGTIEGNQFISIIADSSSEIRATVLASDCLNNQGVQLIIYDPSFNPVSNCFSSSNNVPGSVIATNLLPGQTYFIMVDGFAGDLCDILITTSGGVNTGPPDPPGEMTISPDTSPLCPGAIVTYSIAPIDGASIYEWIIPGNAITVSGGGENDQFVTVEFTSPGGGVVRVTPENACFPGIPAIVPVVVLPILPNLKPTEFICQHDFPIIRDGNIFSEAGTHQVTLQTALGCDSLIIYTFIPNIQIPNLMDTMICDGGSIQIGNEIFTESSTKTVILKPPFNQVNGCDSIVILRLQVGNKVSSDFEIDAKLCVGEPAEILFRDSIFPTAIFNWDYDGGRLVASSGNSSQVVFDTPGIHRISLQVEDEGCVSDLTTKTVIVNDKLANPLVSCNASLTSATFSWLPILGATQYRVDVISGQTGQLNGTEFFVQGLSPNEEVNIEVTAVSIFNCGNGVTTATCIAQDCPNLNVSIQPISAVCLDRNAVPIQLTPLGIGTGNLEWTGTTISPDGIFDPNDAGVGIHEIEMNYSESTCNYRAQIFIDVIPPPIATFELISEICVDKNFTVNYTGNAPITADFQWDFSTATTISGVNAGPFELKFPEAGDFEISLTVNENNCLSETISESIEVINPEPAPVVRCTPSKRAVLFEWDANPDVISYHITLNDTTVIGSQLDPNFNKDNLDDGEEVEIKVVANVVSICDDPFTVLKCAALICPPINIEIEGIPETICEGEDFNKTLNASNDLGTSFTSCNWSGNGVSTDGIFNPKSLTPGINFLRIDCLNGLCEYTKSATFEVLPKPKLDAKILSPVWYPGIFGGIDITPQGGTVPYNFSWTNGDSTEDLSNVPRGPQYCLTVSDSNSCIVQDCYALGEGIFRIKPLTVICENEGVRLPIRPGRGANFKWSPSIGLSCDDCSDPIVNPSESTTYKITATFANGRSESITILAIVIPESICPESMAIQNIADRYTNSELDFSKKDLFDLEKEIIESLPKNKVTVAPNPSTGQLKISSFFNIEHLEIFDFSGRRVLIKKEFSKKIKTDEIDLSNFPKGVYFLKIKTGGQMVVERVVLI